MNKLVYISLLSILILYAHCEGSSSSSSSKDNEKTQETTTANCKGYELKDGEPCDKLKVSDSTKKKCVEKTENKKKVCDEVDKENAGEILSIFKISFALLIIFTIL